MIADYPDAQVNRRSPEQRRAARSIVMALFAAVLVLPAGAMETNWAELGLLAQDPRTVKEVPWRVGASVGDFTHRIPIRLPKFYGIEPKLSLDYSSAIGGGHLGKGWRLSGLQTIDLRGRRQSPARCDGRDRFFFQGLELIPCSEQDYLSPSCAAGGTHSTRIESYLRFVRNEPADTWVVAQTDGTQLVFEATDQGGARCASAAWRYRPHRINDTLGNEVCIKYDMGMSTGSSRWLESKPQRIRLGCGTPGVQFYYGARTAPDAGRGNAGWVVESGSLLKTVRVIADDGSNARAYVLSYDTEDHLVAVTEYGTDVLVDSSGHVSHGTALPSSRFDYSSDPIGFEGSVVWPGVRGGAGGIATIREIHEGQLSTALVDMNGDGLLDQVQDYSGSPMVVALNTGASFHFAQLFPGHFGETVTVEAGGHTEGRRTIIDIADINGDRLPDSLARNEYGLWVGLNKGGYFDTNRVLWSGDLGQVPRGYAIRNTTHRGRTNLDLVDMNGDGLLDHVRRGKIDRQDVDGDGVLDSPLLVALNTGYSFATPELWNTPVGATSPSTTSRTYDTGPALRYDLDGIIHVMTELVDMNGDGLPDLISYHQGNLLIAVNTGQGFAEPMVWDNPPHIIRGSHQNDGIGLSYDLVDVNGDRLPDAVIGGESHSDGMSVRLNTGTGFSSSLKALPRYSYNSWRHTLPVFNTVKNDVVDIDGDGRLDFVDMSNDGVFVYRGRSDPSCTEPGIVRKITTPLGGTVKIDYISSTGGQNILLDPSEQTFAPLTQTVAATTLDAGRGGIATTSYAYFGGRYDYANSQRLGFGTVVTTLPLLTEETTAPYLVTHYHQDPASAMKPSRIDRFNGTGQDFIRERYFYETNDADLPMTSVNTYELHRVGDSENMAAWFSKWTYDLYGNVTAQIDSSEARMERVTRIDYEPNLEEFVVRMPSLVESGTYDYDDPIGPLETKVRYYYDSASDWRTPPEAGLLTRVSKWVDTTRSFENTFIDYDRWGNVQTLEDPRAMVTTFTWDPAYHKFLVETSNAKDHTETAPLTAWNIACEKSTSVTDANGQVSIAGYDELCRPSWGNFAGGASFHFEYLDLGDPASQRIVVRDTAPWQVPDYHSIGHFDGIGRTWRTQGTAPAPHHHIIEETEYDRRGNIQRISRPFSASEPARWTTYEYDAFDRVVAITSPGNHTYTKEYSMLEETFRDPLGNELAQTRDAFGRILVREERYRDSSGADVIATTSYTYDSFGNLINIEDDLGNIWMYQYDSLSRPIAVEDPDRGNTTIQYLPGRLVRAITDNKGQTVELTYDELGRRTTKTTRYADGMAEACVAWDYDVDYSSSELVRPWGPPASGLEQVNGDFAPIGRVTRVRDFRLGEPAGSCEGLVCAQEASCCDGTWTAHCAQKAYQICDTPEAVTSRMRYFANGQPARRSVMAGGQLHLFDWAYDPAGRLLATRYPNDATVGDLSSPLEYDAAGRLRRIPGIVDNLTYTATGKIETQQNTNGTETTWSYLPGAEWLDSAVVTSGARVHYSVDYDYNDAGWVTGKTELVGSDDVNNWTFAYDGLHRLVSASDGLVRRYEYDSIGNMMFNSPIGVYDYSATQPHAVTDAGDIGLEYDLNGNMISRGELDAGLRYEWDVEDRLVTAVDHSNVSSDPVTHDYSYDVDGRRIIAKRSRTFVLVASLDLILPYTETKATTYPDRDYESSDTGGDTIFVRIGDRLVGRISNGTTTWLHTDRLNSAMIETDATAANVSWQDFQPFGEVKDSNGSLMRGYIGEELDPTGLMYLNARYYDPSIGRFLSPDPFRQFDPKGLNVYSYARNNPIAYVDPSGLDAVCLYTGGCSAQGPTWWESANQRVSDAYVAVMNRLYSAARHSTVNVQSGVPEFSPTHAVIQRLEGDLVSGVPELIELLDAIQDHPAALAAQLALGAAEGALARRAIKNVLRNANYAQKTFGETFSAAGKFAGRTVDDVAASLRLGELSTADVPIDYIVRDGRTLILNTRSSQALTRAEIPRSQWNAVNRTGQPAYEARLTGQLNRNDLTSGGIPTLRLSGWN